MRDRVLTVVKVVRFPGEVAAWISVEADRMGVSGGEVVRRAVALLRAHAEELGGDG